MAQTSDVQVLTKQAVKPVVLPRAKTASRLAYIDILKMVLIILVIMVHAAVTYGSLGSWVYEDPVQDEASSILLSIFVIICQSFFMGLFFFFAGYFTPGSYDRKGMWVFWKDRLLRFGIPIVAYTWFLSKIPNYIDETANHALHMPFGQYFITYFWDVQDEGPTWFLLALLIFSAGYTLWRLASRKFAKSSWLERLPAPNIRALLGFAVLVGALSFAVSQEYPIAMPYDLFGIFSLLLSFFPSYILLFIAGILVYRSGSSGAGDWLARIPGKTLRFWGWFSAALAISLPVFLVLGGAPDGHLPQFMTGLNWRCITFNLWLGLACISFSLTLTLWLRDRVKPQNRLAALVGPNTFGVYLIHPLVLVPITLGLSTLAIPTLVKFGLASLFTVVICYLLADGLRRLPGAKAIL